MRYVDERVTINAGLRRRAEWADDRFSLFLLSLVWPKDSDRDDEDMKELLNDARLLKKLKKGKINEEDFEREVTGKLKGKQGAAEPADDSEDEDV